MLNIPDEYKTGNAKLDKAIARKLEKDGMVQVNPRTILYTDKAVIGKPNKYNVSDKSKRTNGVTTWDSTKEMDRWNELLLRERAGEIKDLRQQVSFELQPEFISKQKGIGDVRAIHYIADFVYTNISFRKGVEGRKVIEDAKGVRTAHYKDKRKIMLYKYAEYLFFEV